LVIALFVITFVVQAFQIPSGSMERTLLIGDYVLVDKVHLANGGILEGIMPYREIRRGDIVVFHYPVDPSQHFVKRAIGLPGDRVRLRDGVVFVNGKALDEGYVIHTVRSSDYYRDNFPTDRDTTGNMNSAWRSAMARYIARGELVVPQDMYFVMGDNRDQSSDSRSQTGNRRPAAHRLSFAQRPIPGRNSRPQRQTRPLRACIGPLLAGRPLETHVSFGAVKQY